MSTLRAAVVGGGIIGTAVARHLARRVDSAEVTLFEKENRLAGHQTGHNSGVVHAGLYYEPGSLKATISRSPQPGPNGTAVKNASAVSLFTL